MRRVLLSSFALLGGLLLGPLSGVAAARTLPSPTQDDIKELDSLQDAVQQFEAASKDYRGTITHVVKLEYEKKRRELQGRYEGQIKVIEVEEKQRRIDAIDLFEKFLAKYPSDKRWTPDVIFRLAELYFERASDDYLAAIDAAQKSGAASPPTPDYQRTIDLYVRLVREFPDYRLLDGAHYLLGYCLGEMTKEAESRQAFLGMVCANKFKALDPPPPPQPSKGKGAAVLFVDPYVDCKPINEKSRFNPEAWTRIGEFHFDYNELELAIAAYGRVLLYKDSPYFDKALYKLAWSYYRADKYPEGIKKFDELVLFSDAKKSESGKEGSDLRQEAIQYLGISFAEKDWNGDAIDDTETGLGRIEAFYKERDAEPHVREVYQKLGDIYFDQTEYLKAIEVYKTLLRKWPYAPDNPKVQDRIVLALERMRNFDAALAEREVLAREYGGKNTDWVKKNRDNPEAIAVGAELAEMSLVKFAVDHHKAAQSAKKLALATSPPDGKKLELASKEYALAATGYANYLEKYPASKNTYEYTYFYAEALYYSQRFAEAAEQYEKIRDSNLDNKYLEDAAFNVIKAYELLLDLEVKAGKISIPSIPTVDKVKAPVTVMQIPEAVKKLQAAYDAYATKVPTSPRLPTMAYKAAETEFRHLDFEKSRPRFQEIIDKYCKDDVAVQAGRAILTSFSIEQNLEKIVEWTDKLQKSQCGTGKLAGGDTGELKKLQGDAKFKIAEKLLAEGKFEAAADAFVRIVDSDPANTGGNNDSALYNAAVGYEKVSRFGAATKIYERIVAEFPQSKFVDEALFRTAVNYQKYFDFDRAVVSYKRLATDARFNGSKYRTDSLYNAAVILENDQGYDEAARLFQTYSNEATVKPEDRAEAFFRSGLIYQKNKDAARTLKTFKDYLARYGTDPKRAIEAQFHMAEAFEMQKDRASTLAQYRKVAAMGASVPAASDAAEYPAKAAFLLVEEDLKNALERMKISLGASKNAAEEFKRTFSKYKEEVARLTAEYNKVIQYKRVTWVLAAYFRIGYVYELLSKSLSTLVTAPCPPEIMKKYKQEGCDVYLEQVSKLIEPLVAGVDQEVVNRYRTTLDQAGKLGVSNEWTRLARQKANAYKPDEFPMTKDERIDFQMETP